MQTKFDAPVRVLDLSSKEAVAEINTWAKEKTWGAIKSVVERLPNGAEIVAVSALYFKGGWAVKFSPHDTKEALFTPAIGKPRSVAFMSQESGAILYREGDGFKAVDLPYANGKFSLVALLPPEGKALQTMLSGKPREIDRLLGWLRGEDFKSARGMFELPKFTLSSSSDLLPALSRKLAADQRPSRAPKGAALRFAFPDLSMSADLSELRQVAMLAIDEEGTEAAAVTAALGSRSVQAGAFYLRFDRPFLIALREKESGMILFLALAQDLGDQKTASR